MKRFLSCLLVPGMFVLMSAPASAQTLNNSGVLNDVFQQFSTAAATWEPRIEAAASTLFWALATISMVWTFGMMLLRKADIRAFFAEFIRFIVFTGFFWWLLTNATNGLGIAPSIIHSMQQLGSQAAGLGNSNLGPSAVLDIGFQLYAKVCTVTGNLHWWHMGTIIVLQLMGLAILLITAVIAVNLLLLMLSCWILLYGGVFFLGFGGSRWTSEMALIYYQAILGIAVKILGMLLIIAVGKKFLMDSMNDLSDSLSYGELAVMLVITVCMLYLVDKLPPMLSRLVDSGIGQDIGNFGSGHALSAASVTVGGASSGGMLGAAGSVLGAGRMAGRMVGSAAMGGAGAASAIKAAYKKAQSNLGR